MSSNQPRQTKAQRREAARLKAKELREASARRERRNMIARRSFIGVAGLGVTGGLGYLVYRGVEAKNGQDAVATLKKALDNVRPTLEVKSRRVGGSTYQVPVEVKPHRANTLALRWLVSYAKGRREKTMTERLQNEILDASNGLGAAVKRREDTHKMAESNRAFAHYRW